MLKKVCTPAERVSHFQSVRDIPYHISLGKEADSSCESKARLLASKLQADGIECKLAECEFRWSELKLPASLLSDIPVDIDAHAFLMVRIPESGKWVKVDPTWDEALRDILPVAEWDGIHSTALAVPGFNVRKSHSSDCGVPEAFEPAVKKWLKRFNAFLRSARGKRNQRRNRTEDREVK